MGVLHRWIAPALTGELRRRVLAGVEVQAVGAFSGHDVLLRIAQGHSVVPDVVVVVVAIGVQD